MDTSGQNFYQIVNEDQEEYGREDSSLWNAMPQQYLLAFLSVDCDSCSAIVLIGSDPVQHVACYSTSLQFHEEAISPNFVEGFLQIDPGSENKFFSPGTHLQFLERDR